MSARFAGDAEICRSTTGPEGSISGGFYIWNLGSLSVCWTEGPLLAGIRTGFAVLPFPGGRNPSRNVIQRFPEPRLGTAAGSAPTPGQPSTVGKPT